MGLLRTLGRIATIGLALALLALGGLALGGVYAPNLALLGTLHDAVVRGALQLTAFDGIGVPAALPGWVQSALESAPAGFAGVAGGVVLLLFALLSGRTRLPPPVDAAGSASGKRPAEDHLLPVEKKAQKRAKKQAAALARAKRHHEAAELCFQSGLMEEAARHFIDAGELTRAAEIRHDQNRFIECAELYVQAKSFESAGAIFAQQEEWKRSAEAYLAAGNKSVAAEMYEKAEDWRRAAECYEASEFPRHAAKAWVRCSEWAKAAENLERAILEGVGGAAHADASRQAETRKLVRMAGDLFVRAGRDERAQAVLERGECWAEAGELALRGGRNEQAVELFQRAHDPVRTAKVLKLMGREADSVRVLAEHHRDRGEDAEAAKLFEQAGEYMAAGDLYRLLEQLEKAGECYEKQGEFALAAEMFRSADQRQRAAENYERAGQNAEAAECWALIGDTAREAELLAKAGSYLRAGQLQHERGNDDEAIVILQQVVPEHTDFARASAILGEIFLSRGMLSLAQKKLTHAVGDGALSRDNLQAAYGLATVYEASSQPQEALELYEKILAFDYNHADVRERLERCKQAVATQSQAERDKSSPLSASAQQGRYRIVGKLGRGGMGIVYKAEDSVLDRTVALKVLPDSLKENPQALKNFLREAKSAAQLNHPNIVTIFDAGEQDGVYYIAMEYVDGNTLKEIVRHRGKISSGGILHVLAQICEALAYAHEKKIVHRDIKTANIMWTRDRKAKIMDFGLAKVIEEVRNHTTVVSGTPYYMSPEQTLGKNVDQRTDIYSLGVSLFELATGTLPFREGNLPYHHVHTPPPDPAEFAPDVSPLVAGIINRCLKKDPAERYASTREILDEIKGALKS